MQLLGVGGGITSDLALERERERREREKSCELNEQTSVLSKDQRITDEGPQMEAFALSTVNLLKPNSLKESATKPQYLHRETL